MKADVWKSQQKQPDDPPKPVSPADEKRFLSISAELDTILKHHDTTSATPQHVLGLLREYRRCMTPGSPLRERACLRLQERYLRDGVVSAPEEAKKLAEKTLHDKMVRLGAVEQSLIANVKGQPEASKLSSSQRRILTPEDKKLRSLSREIETIFNKLETSSSTPQHLVKLLREYRHLLVPGSPTRERACEHLLHKYLRDGTAKTPEEARKLAEKTLHDKFASFGAIEQSLVAKIKEHPEMGTQSLKDFIANPKNAEVAALLFKAKGLYSTISQNFIAAALDSMSKPVSKPASTSSAPSPSTSSYRGVVASATPRIEVQQVAPQAQPALIFSAEKPKGTAEVIAEANKQFSIDRVRKEKEAERKAAHHDAVDDKIKKRLAQAIHDALVECQRLVTRGSVNFTPSVMHFVSKADMLALLGQIRQENAAQMVAKGSESEKLQDSTQPARFKAA